MDCNKPVTVYALIAFALMPAAIAADTDTQHFQLKENQTASVSVSFLGDNELSASVSEDGKAGSEQKWNNKRSDLQHDRTFKASGGPSQFTVKAFVKHNSAKSKKPEKLPWSPCPSKDFGTLPGQPNTQIFGFDDTANHSISPSEYSYSNIKVKVVKTN